jgi:hypothetical protein
MSVYREQQKYDLELAMNGDRVLLDWSVEHSLDDEPRLLVRVEEGFLDADPLGFEARISLEHTTTFHRYLSALVLPTVQMYISDFDPSRVRFWSGVAPNSRIGATPSEGHIWAGKEGYTPQEARAFAACLLAAADEAEGV